MKSMTGFAETVTEIGSCRVRMRIRAVNGRYLDPQFRLPDDLLVLEPELLTRLKQQVARGRVTVWLDLEPGGGDATRVVIDQAIMNPLARQFQELQDQYPMLQFSIPLTALFNRELPLLTNPLATANDPDTTGAMLAAFDELVARFNECRAREGEQLAADMSDRLAALAGLVDEVEQFREGLFDRLLARYRERLAKLLGDGVDENRLVQEAGLMADRLDISEEITRLRAHIGAFSETAAADGPVGKKLDFLVQEMNREVNTIGSKARDEGIGRHVVEMKTILEKIREQVQNIE